MYYGTQQPVQLIPMMNLDQYIRYMKDGAAANGQDTSLTKLRKNLVKYNPGQATIDKIVSSLKP
jgi:hypothetical protein